jgi:hypothetical protein
MFQNKTLGDLIEQDFLGSIGMRTGSFTNELALQRRQDAIADQKAAFSSPPRPTRDPVPPPSFLPPLPVNPAQNKAPEKTPPCFGCSGQVANNDRWFIPAWQWFVGGLISGLLSPLVLPLLF